jgi:hypothetical protein
MLVSVATFLSAAAAEPVIRGLDHIPVAVADLDRARTDFEALGFVLKPGRAHANGLRNVHAKFPDGTEIELITASTATDDLSAEYLAWLKTGDGAVFVGFYAPDLNSLASSISDLGSPLVLDNGLVIFPRPSLFHHLFFGRRQRSPTDRPEHFAHANTASGLVGVWLAEDPATHSLLRMLEASPSNEPRSSSFALPLPYRPDRSSAPRLRSRAWRRRDVSSRRTGFVSKTRRAHATACGSGRPPPMASGSSSASRSRTDEA